MVYLLFFIDPAEIIQNRYNELENCFEYYVHYDGFNRRLDEWVQKHRIMNSRFDMSEQHWKNKENQAIDLLDQSDRKITRNQKRRHDEINHVQKVSMIFVLQKEKKNG
jgi:Histone acetyltransferase (MYST family)